MLWASSMNPITPLHPMLVWAHSMHPLITAHTPNGGLGTLHEPLTPLLSNVGLGRLLGELLGPWLVLSARTNIGHLGGGGLV